MSVQKLYSVVSIFFVVSPISVSMYIKKIERKGYLQLISSQTIIRRIKNIIRKYFFYIIKSSFLYYKEIIFHIKYEGHNSVFIVHTFVAETHPFAI